MNDSTPPSPAPPTSTPPRPAQALAEALAEAPVSTVHVLSSTPATASVASTSSAARGRVEPVVGAKAEGTMAQLSPTTPRTEQASPAGGPGTQMTITPIRASLRRGIVGPFAFSPETPMLVMPLAELDSAGCFPRYEDAMKSGALVACDSLARGSAFVVFVSHRWVKKASNGAGEGAAGREGEGLWGMAGGAGSGGGEGGAPDVDSTKHSCLVEGLNSTLASLPREVTVFVWIDYSCIDQVRKQRRVFLVGVGWVGL